MNFEEDNPKYFSIIYNVEWVDFKHRKNQMYVSALSDLIWEQSLLALVYNCVALLRLSSLQTVLDIFLDQQILSFLPVFSRNRDNRLSRIDCNKRLIVYLLNLINRKTKMTSALFELGGQNTRVNVANYSIQNPKTLGYHGSSWDFIDFF